jgi:hypothetical protein
MLAAAAIVLAAVSAAPAQEPRPEPLTIQQVIEITNSLTEIKCESTPTKAGVKECAPLKVGLAWQIALILRRATNVVQEYQRIVTAHLATLPRKADGSDLTPEGMVKFQAYQTELLAKTAFPGEEGLPHLKRGDLEPLNLAPSILSGLWPIIDQ